MFNLDIFVFEFMQNKGKIVKIAQNFNITAQNCLVKDKQFNAFYQ